MNEVYIRKEKGDLLFNKEKPKNDYKNKITWFTLKKLWNPTQDECQRRGGYLLDAYRVNLPYRDEHDKD